MYTIKIDGNFVKVIKITEQGTVKVIYPIEIFLTKTGKELIEDFEWCLSNML